MLPEIKLIDMSNSSTYTSKGYKRLKDAAVADARQIDSRTTDPILKLLAKYTTSGPALLAIIETACSLQGEVSAEEIESSLQQAAERHAARIEARYRESAEIQAARRVRAIEDASYKRAGNIVSKAKSDAEKILEDAATRASDALKGSKFDRCNEAAVQTIKSDLVAAANILDGKSDLATLARTADAIRYERNRLLKEKDAPKEAPKPNPYEGMFNQ